nr:PEP-CTERM system TPR-repeat protein PrsT [Dechloromonas sp.]
MLAAALSLPLTVLANSSEASRYFEDALVRYQKQDMPGAIIQLRNALKLDSKMLSAHLLLAKAYLASSEVNLAELEFKEALTLGVSRAEVAVPLARIFMLQGKPAKVIEVIQDDGLPADVRPEVLTLRASAFAALGKSADADRSFAEARAAAPMSPGPLVAEVPIQIGLGRLDLARTRAEMAVQLGPGDASAFSARAQVAHASGDVQSALKDYERAIALAPNHYDARIARAGLWIDLGHDIEASADLDAMAKSGPIEPRVAYLQALIASRKGDTALAKQYMAKALQVIDALPPEWIEGHESLLMVGALAHHAGRKYEKALKYLDVLITRYPHNLSAKKLLAAIYLDKGDNARASRLLETVLRTQPDDTQAQYLLGRVKLAEKQYARATEILEKATQGGNAKAQASLGYSMLGQGDSVAARKNLAAAFDKTPNDLALAITLANTLMQQGEKRKALDVAQRCNKALPGNPGALNLLGAIKGANGDLPGARTAYAEALKRDPNFSPAQLNLARVEVVEGYFDAARKVYSNLLAKDKKNTQVMYEASLLEQRAGKPADALRWLEKAVAENPNDLRIGLALIQAKAATGDKSGALEAAKALSLRNKDNIAASAALAQSQIDIGDNKSARQTLINMQRVAGFDTDSLIRIGYLSIAAGYPADASYVAQKALQGKPDDLGALVLAAEAALQSRENSKAGEFGKQIRQKYPGNSEGYRISGDSALALGQYAIATDYFRQAFDRQPSTAILKRRVSVFVAQGKPGAALPMLQEWIKSHAKDTEARKVLAEVRMRTGEWTAARREYETIISYGVRDASVFNNLANTLLELKDPKAVEIARQAQAIDPRSPLVLDTLGWSLHVAGKVDEALLILRDARLRDPNNIDIRFHLAGVLVTLGRNDEARVELRGILEQISRDNIGTERATLIKTLGM